MQAYEKLEGEFAKFTGSNYAIAVNSGTSALHLALLAVGVGKGDEVIVPDLTMAACGFAVSYTGAKVVTVDCGDDFNINPDLIEGKITSKTKAIMPVHIYGRLCDMGKIREIADKHNLYVIEDASEAHGAVYESSADITCYSLYQNKIIHAEEGGIITTNNQDLVKEINYLKNMAFNEAHDFYHEKIGFNYRIPNGQAYLALNSLSKYPRIRQEREIIFNRLDRMNPNPLPKRQANWVYDFIPVEGTPFQKDRCFFKPLSTMPMWKQKIGPNALKYSQLGYYLKIDFE